METLRYSRGKLLAAAAVAALMTVIFIAVLVSPDGVGGRWGRLFRSDFGQYLFGPLLIVMCGSFAVRAAAIGLGSLAAIECSPARLAVGTFWGRASVAWSSLESVRLERVGGGEQLAFRVSSGGLFGARTLRVALGFTDLHGSRSGELAAAIADYRVAAVAGMGPAPAAADDEERFDADQAMARYLARKAAGGAQAAAPAAAVPSQPPRPTFGRKGL